MGKTKLTSFIFFVVGSLSTIGLLLLLFSDAGY